MRIPKLLPTPLFKQPVGPSEIHPDSWGWNVVGGGSDLGDVTCGLCGTHHPKETSVTHGQFLGIYYVEQCCGGVADVLYREFGEAFFSQRLKEIASDPLEHRLELDEIREALETAKANLAEAQGAVEACQNLLAETS